MRKTLFWRALEWIFATISAVLALWIIFTTIDIAREGWTAIPVVDMWDRWSTYFRDKYTWGWFWQQHVDHRLLAPKLLFALDHLVFNGRGWFLLVCSLGLQAVTGVLLFRLSGHAFARDRTERLILAAAIMACLFSGQQWINFIMPFQVQFPMVYCAAITAIFALWKSSQTNQPWRVPWIALIIGAGVVGTYSMANGLLLWPILLMAATWLRAPRRVTVALTVAAILLGSTYLYHFRREHVPLPLSLSERATRTDVFLFANLGSPMATTITLWKSEDARQATTIVAGVLMLIILIAMSLRLRRRSHCTTAHGMLIFYSIFLAGTSMLIAYGRSEDMQMHAFMSKYLTPVYILWATMLLVAWPAMRQLLVLETDRWRRVVVYGMLCAVIWQLVATGQLAILAAVQQQTAGVHLGEVAVVDNVTDPEAWYWLFHPPEVTLGTIDLLRTNRLTLFTEEWTHWPGSLFDKRFTTDSNPDACQGKIEQAVMVSTMQPGWRITGSAWVNSKAWRPASYVIFSDASGVVAGVAIPGCLLPQGLHVPPGQTVASTWTGYVAGNPPSVTVYALEQDDKSVCAIGTVKLATVGNAPNLRH